MQDVNGAHKRMVELKLREEEAEAGRKKHLSRVANAQAVSLRVLCDTPLDCIDVLVDLLASFAAGSNVTVEQLRGPLERAHAGAAQEIRAIQKQTAVIGGGR